MIFHLIFLPENEEEPIDIGDALKQLNNIRERKSEVVNKMRSYLDELKNIGEAIYEQQ